MTEARNKQISVYDFTHKELPRIGKFIKTESRIEITRGWGRGIGCYCLRDTRFLSGVIKSLEMDSNDGCTTL